MTIQIGIDFDEPMYPWYDQAHQVCLRDGLAKSWHEPEEWAPFKLYGVAQEEWVAALDAEAHKPNGGILYGMGLKPGVLADIKFMYTHGYGIHILTARGSFGGNEETKALIRMHTMNCLLHSGVPYDTISFGRDKVAKALELGIDYHIDDAPHNYDELDEAGVNVWMLNERWNKPWDDGRRRVTSLHQFCTMIYNTHGIQYDKTIRPVGANG